MLIETFKKACPFGYTPNVFFVFYASQKNRMSASPNLPRNRNNISQSTPLTFVILHSAIDF